MSLPRRTLLALAALAALVAAGTLGPPAVAAPPAIAQPKLVFGSDASFPPMEFLDAHRNLAGFDIDLIKAVAKAGGFEAVVRNTAWDGIFAGLGAGDYDAVLSAVTITEQRKATMDFSLPYVNAGQVIVTSKGNRSATSLEQFAGKKVGVQIGTTGASEVARHRNLALKTYDEAGLAVEDLYAGRIDAVVIDSPTAASYVVQNEKYRGRLAIVGKPFTDERYGIAVRKGNARTLELVNKGLRVVLKDGTIDKLTEKWLK
jgi:polar amino acid transport system substrate-binding protein